MKTIDEMIAVMKAYQEGKEIEFRCNGSVFKEWEKTDSPAWNWGVNDYRIKN